MYTRIITEKKEFFPEKKQIYNPNCNIGTYKSVYNSAIII